MQNTGSMKENVTCLRDFITSNSDWQIEINYVILFFQWLVNDVLLRVKSSHGNYKTSLTIICTIKAMRLIANIGGK